jgi:hypothetical protein
MRKVEDRAPTIAPAFRGRRHCHDTDDSDTVATVLRHRHDICKMQQIVRIARPFLVTSDRNPLVCNNLRRGTRHALHVGCDTTYVPRNMRAVTRWR